MLAPWLTRSIVLVAPQEAAFAVDLANQYNGQAGYGKVTVTSMRDGRMAVISYPGRG